MSIKVKQRLYLPPRTATVVVAASNASAMSKAQADRVCSGVADEVEINAAIAALPASGGSIYLTEGTFKVSDTILMDKEVALLGAGIDITYIEQAVGATAAITKVYRAASPAIPFGLMSGFRIKGNGVATTPAIQLGRNCPDFKLTSIWISGHAGNCIQIDADAGWDFILEDLIVESNTGNGLVAAANLSGIIRGCSFVANKIGVELGGGLSSRWEITGGRIMKNAQHNLKVISPGSFSISGTMITDAGGKTPTLNTYDDILLTTDGAIGIRSVMIANIPYMGAFGVDGSTRYCINIDRNGVSLANAVIAIDGVNFHSPATDAIKLDTTLNLKNVRIRNVNGAWAILDPYAMAREPHMRWDNMTSVVAGTGNSSINLANSISLWTGASASSSALRYTGHLVGLTRPGVHYGYFEYDSPLRMIFEIARELEGDNPVAYMQLKAANTIGDLEGKGLGVKVSAFDLTAEAHDGTERTETSIMTMGNAAMYMVDIILIPGKSIIWLVDGVVKVIQTTKLPSGTLNDETRVMVSISTTNAGAAYFRCTRPRILRLM